MFRIEDFIFTLETVAKAQKVKAVGVAQYRQYENNKPTDKIGGYAYECVCPLQKYEKIIVKVPDLPPVLDNDDIDEDTFIAFEGFVARFYRDRNGLYQLSCRADKAIIV